MNASTGDLPTRLAAFHRSGDPAALWPHLAPSDLRLAHRRVAETTARALNSTGAPVAVEASPPSASAVGVAAYTAGVGPLLGYWIATGRLTAPADVTAVLADHLEHGRRRATKLGGILEVVAGALGEHGIDAVVMKGAHTGRQYFPEPGVRPTSDIDLLIAPDEYPRAAIALGQVGLIERVRTSIPPRSVWTVRTPDTIHAVDLEHENNPWSVDLHTELTRNYFRGLTADLGRVEEEKEDDDDDDVDDKMDDLPPPLRTVPQPLLTAHLAVNASHHIHELRLLHIVELILVLRRDLGTGRLTWDALTDRLRATGTSRFAYPALALAARIAPDTVDADLVESLSGAATARTRRVIERVYAEGMNGMLTRSTDDKLMWASGPGEWARNVWDLLWPEAPEARLTDRLRMYRRRLRLLAAGRVVTR